MYRNHTQLPYFPTANLNKKFELQASLTKKFQASPEERITTAGKAKPPYRPLSDTSIFNDYTKEAFNDDAQIRLKEYCDRINEAGFRFMLSNSGYKKKGGQLH